MNKEQDAAEVARQTRLREERAVADAERARRDAAGRRR